MSEKIQLLCGKTRQNFIDKNPKIIEIGLFLSEFQPFKVRIFDDFSNSLTEGVWGLKLSYFESRENSNSSEEMLIKISCRVGEI